MNILTSPNFHEIKTARDLPSSNGIVRHVVNIAQREDVAPEEMMRIVKSDPALAARVIKAANTSVADGRPVVAIPDAIAALGVRNVRQLALGFSLLSQTDETACKNFHYGRYWEISVATAIAFAAAAARMHVAPPEEAYVMGLLSGIGGIALATIYPREYAVVLAQARANPQKSLLEVERSAFATDHNELCAALLSEWGMPRPLVEAVYYHEAPHQCGFADGSRVLVAAQMLHFARVVGERCIARPEQHAELDRTLVRTAKTAAVSSDTCDALLAQTLAEWEQGRGLLADQQTEAPEQKRLDIVGCPLEAGQTATSGLKLLVADDDPAIAEYLRKMLSANGHEVLTACNGKEALALALTKLPHVIITDWLMPEMDGVSLCRALRQTALGRAIYVLVMTDSQDMTRLIEAFDAGADDYLRKPVSPKVLTARLRAAQRVLHMHADFERDREEMHRVAAELAIENRRYQQATLTDPLTRFPNRRYALERLEQEWLVAKRLGRPFACLLIDIDHFKSVNDTHGHDAGDRVLQHTAQVLRQTLRGHDVMSRFGGEEFLVVCPSTGAKGAQTCAERLRAAIESAHVTLGASDVAVTVSIGVSVWSRGAASTETLLKAADVALYAAKERGRNCVSFTAASSIQSSQPSEQVSSSIVPVATQ